VDGVHDIGGTDGFGAVVTDDGAAIFHEPWEARAFSLEMVTAYERLRRDSGRATRERMEPVHYLAASYYERWLWAAEQGLLAAGTIAPGEIEAWEERIAAGEPVPTTSDPGQAARLIAAIESPTRLPMPHDTAYHVGDAVRVRRRRDAGHSRCPRYLRGAAGTVERVQCDDDGVVYLVRFSSGEVFGTTTEAAHVLFADLWEPYLEPA
jgi:nitrile hydratase